MKLHQLVANGASGWFWIANLSFCHSTLLACKYIAVVFVLNADCIIKSMVKFVLTSIYRYISKHLSLFLSSWKENRAHIALLTGFGIVHFSGESLQIKSCITFFKYSASNRKKNRKEKQVIKPAGHWLTKQISFHCDCKIKSTEFSLIWCLYV